MAPGRLIPSESFGNGMDISGALIDDGKSADESDLDSPSDVLENATVAQNVSRAGLDGASKKSEVISEGGDGENDASDDDDAEFIAARQAASNRKTSKQNKSTKKSRGFQSLGLDGRLLKAITRKGFAVPTPIQRKTLPILIDGQDVVGMARTGSGKTAAFVIPMIQKLKAHKVQMGARAIIMSPSRELALQTLKAVKELGKGTDLRTVLIVGGDSLEDQFSQMTLNPDVIVATPGRFLHLFVEMGLDLSSVSYVVFDEADRLFEMGFQAQLTEILFKLPVSRQTMLFSATLPKSLVEFARAGLRDPQLVRLDAETKISPDLESAFMSIKSADKDGALLYLLTHVIKMPQRDLARKQEDKNSKKRKREDNQASGSLDPPTAHSTIVFAASQKQVEYLTSLLGALGYAVSFVYGNLDQTARKANIEDFRSAKTSLLVVTDLAARGLDIPLLANVINYDFPAQPKAWIHRVGRVARAGRKGWSYNLLENGDLPYLLDLQLLVGRRLTIGAFPKTGIELSCESVSKILDDDGDISMQRDVAIRAKKQYLCSRSSASADSAKRAKDLEKAQALSAIHPIFQDFDVPQSSDLLARIGGFRPAETVFEIGQRGENESTEALRRLRRRLHDKKQQAAEIVEPHQERQDFPNARDLGGASDDPNEAGNPLQSLHDRTANLGGRDEAAGEEEPSTSASEAPTSDFRKWHDTENYISYQPRESSSAEDRAYRVRSGSFVDAARGATLDLDNDEIARSFGEPSPARWDKRSKKYVSRANDEDGSKGAKIITGESGQKLAASFRSGRFDAWKKANRIERLARPGEREAPSAVQLPGGSKKFKHFADRAPKRPDKYRDDCHAKKRKVAERASANTAGALRSPRPAKNELRSADDVRKQRLLKQKRREKNARPSRKPKR